MQHPSSECGYSSGYWISTAELLIFIWQLNLENTPGEGGGGGGGYCSNSVITSVFTSMVGSTAIICHRPMGSELKF